MTDSNGLREYRAQLVEIENRSQTTFDRTVLTLSGGALGVSFTFVEQFVGSGPAVQSGFLLAAWIAWTSSLAIILLSHYFSTLAIRATIEQVDAGTIYDERPGRWYDTAVKWANLLGAFLFILGVIFVVVFSMSNLGG